MKTEQVYVAEDGRRFSGETAEKDCQEYEKRLVEKNKAAKEKEKDLKAIQDDADSLQKAISEYYKKYGEYAWINEKTYRSPLFSNPVFDMLFDERFF